MGDLWSQERERRRRSVEPLAYRMRPRTLAEVLGQGHFLGQGGLLRRMLEADRLTSVIFWGPPGTGKTTLAEVVAAHTGRHFERANAALIGVKQIREVLEAAQRRLEDDGRRTILFLDEIHRFSRAQQDVLLHDVERGLITLIGATTENPAFSVNSPLLSRSSVFRFEPLGEDDVRTLVRRALTDERGYAHLNIEVTEEALAHWARLCDGDARKALGALEVAVASQQSNAGPVEGGPAARPLVIDLPAAEQSIQAKAVTYDGTGDEHYDVISALIKSVRGGDPDAGIYWLARMLHAGEDPRFIARRLAILASEDIGNADPQAIVVATSAWLLTERVGMPECQHTLAQAVTYLATAPKSNASARAIWSALEDVEQGRTLPVPRHLRASPQIGTAPGAGENYVYPHDAADGYVRQEYLGVERVYYAPVERGFEAVIRRRLDAQQTTKPSGEGTDLPAAPDAASDDDD